MQWVDGQFINSEKSICNRDVGEGEGRGGEGVYVGVCISAWQCKGREEGRGMDQIHVRTARYIDVTSFNPAQLSGRDNY